jgi:acetyltransferase
MKPPGRYPVEWIDRIRLPRGAWVTLRPVLPQDEALERQFIAEGLTAQSRYLRFQNGLRQLPEPVLRSFTRIDYDSQFALLAESFEDGRHVLVADARYVRDPVAPQRAEFGLAVADDWQGQGLGRHLLRTLTRVAQAQGIEELYGDVLRGNARMVAIARDQEFLPGRHPDDATLVRLHRRMVIAVQPPRAPSAFARWLLGQRREAPRRCGAF